MCVGSILGDHVKVNERIMIIDIHVTDWIVQAVMSSTMIQRIQSEGIRGQTRR